MFHRILNKFEEKLELILTVLSYLINIGFNLKVFIEFQTKISTCTLFRPMTFIRRGDLRSVSEILAVESRPRLFHQHSTDA